MKGKLGKIGTIILAMVVGLGLLGVGFSYWSDTLSITGAVQTGTVSNDLTCDGCSPSAISCNAAGSVLAVTVTNIQGSVAYSCDFHIENTGSIPVKVLKQELTKVSDNVSAKLISPAVPLTACKWYYVNVDATPPTVREDTVPKAGDDFAFHLSAYAQFEQIDPGDTESGTVHVSLVDSARVGDDFDFTVAFSVVPWNQ